MDVGMDGGTTVAEMGHCGCKMGFQNPILQGGYSTVCTNRGGTESGLKGAVQRFCRLSRMSIFGG